MPVPMNKEPPTSIIVAAVLLLLMGVSMGMGGFILLIQGNVTLPEINVRASLLPFFGLFLIAFGLTEMVAALGLLMLKRICWMLALIATTVFIAIGAINGYFFFGRSGVQGTILNISLAALIIGCLLLGRKALARKAKQWWQ